MREKTNDLFGAEALDLEQALENNRAFLKSVFESWYNAANVAHAIDKVEDIDPTTQDYPALAQDIDAAKFGEYTLNPETQGIDFESAKVFIPDLSQFEAKTGPPAKPAAKLAEVARYVMDTYGDTHHVPGIEYWKWLIEHPGETPQNLKDGKFYFFPGSVLRGREGSWSVPSADWDGSEWDRYASWLTLDWSSGYRVVLLEK